MKVRYFLEGIVSVLLVASAVYSLMPNIEHVHDYQVDQKKMTYDGRMEDHKFSGEGTLIFADQTKYQGGFQDGQFNGQGKFTSNKNWIYQGGFKDGAPDGSGKLTIDGQTYRETFKKGQLVNAH